MTRLANKITELAHRVEENVPDRRNPEAWHVEKSEIAHELRRIAKEVKK